MKKKLLYLASIVVGVITPISVFASESGTANSAVVTAMTSTANDMIATGNSVLPVALGVVTLSMVVMFGLRIFTRVTGTRR